MNHKLVKEILCASTILALTVQFSCIKKDVATEDGGVKSETLSKTDPTAANAQSVGTEENSSVTRGPILPTNKLEKPLAANLSTDKKPGTGTYSTLSGGTYYCGSSMNESYYGSG